MRLGDSNSRKYLVGAALTPVLFAGGFIAAKATSDEPASAAAAALRTEGAVPAVSVSTISKVASLPPLPAPRKRSSASTRSAPAASAPAAAAPAAAVPAAPAPQSRPSRPAPRTKKPSGGGRKTVTIISDPQ